MEAHLGIDRRPVRTRLTLILGAVLSLAALAAGPSPAHAQTTDGCTYVGYGPRTCEYRATGPGRYVAYLPAGYAVIRVNGLTAVEIYQSGSIERGSFAARPGDVVKLVISRTSCEFCFSAPPAGYVRVRNQ